MQSTLTGLVILGIAILIAVSSRDNTNETAAQTFGTLGLILVLSLVGLSFVRRGEAERLRNKRRGPGAPSFKPPMAGGKGPHAFPHQRSSFEVPEEVQKAVIGFLILVSTLATAYGLKLYFFPSALSKLAQIESPKAVEKGKIQLDPILDKVAERFGQDRDQVEQTLWETWEAHQKPLLEYGLKPTSFAREILQAAPKSDNDLEKLAGDLAQEKPAARLARLHQPKPAPGKYPQEAEFQSLLEQLGKKTGMGAKPLCSALVNRWRVVFEKKKRSRDYSLLWFTRLVNSKTSKGEKRTAWLGRLSKMGQ
jgi:hypothetical protein